MEKLPSGVPGLDVVLGGGLMPGTVLVIAGGPGTGKTTLGHQICYANATAEHHAVYYTTLSEPHSKLARNLKGFAFFDPEALESRIQHLHLGDLIRDDSPGRMEPLVDEVVKRAIAEKPSVIVIDSARALRDFADERELRMAFYDITSRLAHTDTALILIGEYTPQEMEGSVEFSLADGIIQLVYEPREPIDRRWLRVVKMRGTQHLEGKHTFRISAAGFKVFPRIETRAGDEAVAVSGRMSSGTPGLDAVMGGGIGCGEATMILGPPGVGKTILGLHFVTEGINRGEDCLYVTFQDTSEQLITMAKGFGWDLGRARDDGHLAIHHVPLDQLDLDVLTDGIRTELEKRTIRRVVIDSVAEMALAAREAERLPAYVRSLTGLVRAAGASLILTSETPTFGPSSEPVGRFTFLFHNVILLRYIERRSETGRALGVFKMRNSHHDKTLHEFFIDQNGLKVGKQLEDVTGVLGWSALRSSDTPDEAPTGR